MTENLFENLKQNDKGDEQKPKEQLPKAVQIDLQDKIIPFSDFISKMNQIDPAGKIQKNKKVWELYLPNVSLPAELNVDNFNAFYIKGQKNLSEKTIFNVEAAQFPLSQLKGKVKNNYGELINQMKLQMDNQKSSYLLVLTELIDSVFNEFFQAKSNKTGMFLPQRLGIQCILSAQPDLLVDYFEKNISNLKVDRYIENQRYMDWINWLLLQTVVFSTDDMNGLAGQFWSELYTHIFLQMQNKQQGYTQVKYAYALQNVFKYIKLQKQLNVPDVNQQIIKLIVGTYCIDIDKYTENDEIVNNYKFNVTQLCENIERKYDEFNVLVCQIDHLGCKINDFTRQYLINLYKGMTQSRMIPQTIEILQQNEQFKFLNFRYIDPELKKIQDEQFKKQQQMLKQTLITAIYILFLYMAIINAIYDPNMKNIIIKTYNYVAQYWPLVVQMFKQLLQFYKLK